MTQPATNYEPWQLRLIEIVSDHTAILALLLGFIAWFGIIGWAISVAFGLIK